MTLSTRPLHADFGAEILGVDVSRSLDDDTFDDIADAIERHSVLLLRGQSLDDESQLAFSRRFGELEFGHVAYGNEGRIEYVGRIGNVDAEGNQLPSRSKRVIFSTGNEMWHSDSSFKKAAHAGVTKRITPSRFVTNIASCVTSNNLINVCSDCCKWAVVSLKF